MGGLRMGRQRLGFRLPIVLVWALAAIGLPSAVVIGGAALPAEASPTQAAAAVNTSPVPGSSTASPMTAVSFFAVDAASVGAVTVTGSVSGDHPGQLNVLPQDAGIAFTPSNAFTAGETVTVTSSIVPAGAEASTWDFEVAVPAPDPGIQLNGDGTDTTSKPGPEFRTNAVSPRFITRPDLAPPAVTINRAATGAAPGLLFATPGAGSTAGTSGGPMIYDNAGQPVWFRPVASTVSTGNLISITYNGSPALTWFEGGPGLSPGDFRGEWVVVNRSYQEIARIRMGNGYRADIHDIFFTQSNTAYLLAYNPITCTGTGRLTGCVTGATVLDAVIQEIDLASGAVLWQWDSLDHVPLADSYVPADGQLFDYIHVNSLDVDTDGNLLVSGRNTSALYKVNRSSGALMWTFGGKRSTFTNQVGNPNSIAGPDYPHDFRPLGGGTYSYFDNGVRRNGPSRAMTVTLNPATATATYGARLSRTPALFAPTQGNSQALPSGSTLVSWGGLSVLTEFSTAGEPVFEATLAGTSSYRQRRYEWTGTPASKPAVVASRSAAGTVVAVSWNGDTRTASWRILTGPTAQSLTEAAVVPRSGFETAASVPQNQWVAVEALDGNGAVLARSTPLEVAAGATRFVESPSAPVGGTYQPLVGNFGGSANDDVIYYRPGTGPDFLHLSDGAGSFTSSQLPSVNGTYTPLVGDFVGDERDEIIWTTRGNASAFIWRFDGNARGAPLAISSASFAVPAAVTDAQVLHHDRTITGANDEILWYAAGSSPDRIDHLDWETSSVAVRSRPISVGGSYVAVTGDYDGNGFDDIFWYAPGPNGDYLWLSNGDQTGTTGHQNTLAPVTGFYATFSGDFTGDGRDSLLYVRPGSSGDYLWSFRNDGSHADRVVTTSATGIGAMLEGPTDELLTWQPGGAPFTWAIGATTSTNRPSGNTALPEGYQPLIGNFVGTDNTSSVLWYAPGPRPERLYS